MVSLPSPQFHLNRALAAVGFGGALVFDTSDRKTAEATFDKIDAIAKK